MLKKAFFLFVLALLIAVFLKSEVLAKKKIGANFKRTSLGITISPKLRSDRLALIVAFGNLQVAKSVSYSLSYSSNGIPQGVGGSIIPSLNAIDRELLFGTCSSGTCRYHTNITGMRFVVTANLKSGQRLTKSYLVRP